MLEGKVAVIACDSSGIALATARLLKSRGAHVVLLGSDDADLAVARATLHGGIFTVRADVTCREDLMMAMRAAHDAYGPIDVMFASSALASPHSCKAAEASFDGLSISHTKFFFNVFSEAFPLMSESAAAIFMSSVGTPCREVYAASAASIRCILHTLSSEVRLLAHRIRTNASNPVIVEDVRSPIPTQTGQGPVPSDIRVGARRSTEDTVRAVLFLACAHLSCERWATPQPFRS